jgi:hypothetical protein
MGVPPLIDDKPHKMIRMGKRKAPSNIMGGLVRR